jgi:hypothetical protein
MGAAAKLTHKGEFGNVTVRRASYYLLFAAATLFFAAHLGNFRLLSPSMDIDVTRAVGLTVMISGLYIVREGKTYLIKSIPLRLVLGGAGLLGFAVVASTMVGR